MSHAETPNHRMNPSAGAALVADTRRPWTPAAGYAERWADDGVSIRRTAHGDALLKRGTQCSGGSRPY